MEHQVKEIVKSIDEAVHEVYELDGFANRIEKLFALLSGDQPVAVMEGDLNNYPIATVNLKERVGDLLTNQFGFPSDAKLDMELYMKESKSFKKLKKKVEPYGYGIDVAFDKSDDLWYSDGFTLVLDTKAEAEKEIKKPVMTSFSALKLAFDQKQHEYEGLMQSKIDEEHVKITNSINEGVWDEYIAAELSKMIILEHRKPCSRTVFPEVREPSTYESYIPLSFIFQFNRDIPFLQKVQRHFRNERGMGVRYLERENHVIQHFLERYPMLADCDFRPSGASIDHADWNGSLGSGAEEMIENTLLLRCELKSEHVKKHLGKIMLFVSNYYGKMDIDSWMQNVKLTDEGVSEKIQHYLLTNPHGKFKITFATVTHEMLQTLYKKGTYGDAFRAEVEKEIRTGRVGELYGEAKEKQDEGYASMRLANLFCASLFVNDSFNAIKKELKKLGYELNVQTLPQEVKYQVVITIE